MAAGTHGELQRALEDLTEGLRALLALDQADPEFIRELRRARDEAPPRARSPRPPSPAAHRRRARPRRPRGGARHLVRVK